MRNPALPLALVALLFAAPASAQVLDTTSQRLDLAGDAPAACVFTQPTAGNASNASFTPTGAASGRINVTQLVDATNATSLASSIELVLPLVCNAANRVEVRSANGGLLRVGGTAGGSGAFSEFLAYRVGLDWAGLTLDRSSDAGAAGLDSASPRTGEVRLRVTTPAGSGPLVAGQYNDTITVDFQVAY